MKNDFLFGTICTGLVGCSIYFFKESVYIGIAAGILTLYAIFSMVIGAIQYFRGTDPTTRIIKAGSENTDKILNEIKDITKKIDTNTQAILTNTQAVLANSQAILKIAEKK